jgi:adenosylcobyric acid synthase
MMGGELRDPEGTEGIIPEARGMGILPTSTVFTSAKTRTRVHAKAEALPFSGCEIDGYEIHMGKTTVNGSPFCRITERAGTEAADGSTGKEAPAGIVPHLDMDGCGTDHAWGTYLHGLFDSGEVTERLAAYLCERKGIPYESAAPVSRLEYVQHQYDILADGVRAALPMDKIYAIMDKYMR